MKGHCCFYLQAVWVKKRWEGNLVVILLAMTACQCFRGRYTDLKSTSGCLCGWLILYSVAVACIFPGITVSQSICSYRFFCFTTKEGKGRQSSRSRPFLPFYQLCHWWELSGAPKLLLQGFTALKVENVECGKLWVEVLWLTDTECNELVKHLEKNKLRY